jgi:hypothetical protein
LSVEVGIDPRVELVAIVCRLAGYEEFQPAGIAGYDTAVESHFRNFARHPAVELARTLRSSSGLAYNAPIEAALIATPDTWAPRVALDPWPDSLDARWNATSLRSFLQALAAFSRDAKAHAFFATHQPLYELIETQLRDRINAAIDLNWYQQQFGVPEKVSFRLVPSLLQGGNNFSAHVPDPQGAIEIVATIGTPRFGPEDAIEYPVDQVLSLLVHEYAHAFVNPWVDRRRDRLQPSVSKIYDAVATQMTRNAYGSWIILAYESLVRANTIRFFQDHASKRVADGLIRADQELGFWWTDELAALLAGPNGAQPRIDQAEAAIFELFERWARAPKRSIDSQRRAHERAERARLRQGPQIKKLIPAHDARSVSSQIGALEIHFDRPMTPETMVLGDVPEVVGAPTWERGGTILRVPVKLEPGRSYVMHLNSDESGDEGFRSQQGELLVPRTWRFQVAP